MDCSLFDVACMVKSAAWATWEGLGPLKQTALVCGVLLIVGGALWGALSAVKRIGGWPAVLGALLILVTAVLSLIPKKPEPKVVAQKKAATAPKKPKTRTIQDMVAEWSTKKK